MLSRWLSNDLKKKNQGQPNYMPSWASDDYLERI